MKCTIKSVVILGVLEVCCTKFLGANRNQEESERKGRSFCSPFGDQSSASGELLSHPGSYSF